MERADKRWEGEIPRLFWKEGRSLPLFGVDMVQKHATARQTKTFLHAQLEEGRHSGQAHRTITMVCCFGGCPTNAAPARQHWHIEARSGFDKLDRFFGLNAHISRTKIADGPDCQTENRSASAKLAWSVFSIKNERRRLDSLE